jgi:Protein kinase domain/Putative zinc-finger
MPGVSTPCPTAQRLAAFAQGKLPPAQAETIAKHLETCPDCLRAVKQVPGDSFCDLVRSARPSGTRLPGGQPATTPPTPPACAVPPELRDHPKFRILAELGRGGMGVVYKAEHLLLGRTVAIKVIAGGLSDNPEALKRFLQGEVRAAGKLDHPNIVKALDADHAGDLHLLVLDYVDGLDLAEAVRRKGPLPLRHACEYIRQAALGLQHAHEQGMIHRDIKPKNLMVTRKGQLKILDFGLAAMTAKDKAPRTRMTQVGSFMGTVEYIAPEQAEDATRADIRSDLYSLGCTLYFLLSGRPPFVQDTDVKIILAHLGEEPPALAEVRPEVPVELGAVVTKMLAKEPGRRYQTPVEVARALAPFCKPGAAPPAAAPAPTPVATARTSDKGTVIATDTARETAVEPPAAAARPTAAAGPEASPFRDLDVDTAGPKTAAPSKKRTTQTGVRGKAGWLIGGGVGVAVLLLVLAGLWAAGVLRVKTKDGTIVLENLPPDAEVLVDGQKVTVTWPGGTRAEISVKPGTRQVVVTKGGVQVVGEQVVIDEGGQKVISARFEPLAKAEAPARSNDLLRTGSVWRGVGEYTARGLPSQPAGKFNATVRITERTGDRFKGSYEFEDGSECASTIEGTMGESVGATGKQKIRWEHVKDTKGNANERFPMEVKGTMEGGVLDVGFSHRDRDTGLVVGSGVMKFQIEEDGAPRADPAPPVVGTWDGTFQDGAKGVFIFIESDHTVTGDNRFKGRWDQMGRKVIVIDEKQNLPPGVGAKWEGEIDRTGKTMTLTNDGSGVVCRYVRR